ncbi:uncharacterized protein TEOVI_000111800 [Trypanosoma equiperdum]|uniref:Uncharacterized protein n=2 Tax=Trypanozoon TaxID=39700 RepID=Q388M0_TRYB2|nr:hypothetical protein, conserved [Trypanosoma brucei brucei TREU927]EAN78750.1 hypothetical protein, conserved [Trypanosoma brucei brucei TREU927]SCU69552.1 hypothetical protein, conserved [Trypanosoma equiperdum]
MATIAELQQAIRDEKEKHEQAMEELRSQRESLASVVAEQQQYTQDIIMRVSELRGRKSQQMLAGNAAPNFAEIDTGCKAVDDILYSIEEGLETSTGKSSVVLGKILAAAVQAVVPGGDKKPSTLSSSSSATRTTDVVVISRNEIRGTHEWVKKHCKKCTACGELNGRPRPWEPPKKTDKGKSIKGNASAPNLRCIPGKNFRSLSLCFRREPCSGTVLELMRISAVVNVQGQSGEQITNPREVAAKITALVVEWVRKEMENAREAAKKAPWCEDGEDGQKFAVAVEMLLHNIDTRVEVFVIPPKNGGNVGGSNHVPMKINVFVVSPLFLSTLQPFVELWGNERDREYMLQGLIKPAIKRIAKLFGVDGVVDHGITVGLKAVDALVRMTKGKHFFEPTSPVKSKSGRPSASQPEQLIGFMHSVILAMSLLGTRIELECAVPDLGDLKDLEDAKRSAFNIAKAFLQRLLPPRQDVAVSLTDPAAADAVLWLRRMPTRMLEVLNNAFSSNSRLPSSLRTGVIDHLASPRLKINYALKNFSEIVIDIFRPYAPNSGMMTVEEKHKGEKARIGACAPVVDIPRDIVRASAEAAAWAKDMQQELLKREAAGVNTKEGEDAVNVVLERTKGDEIMANFLKEMQDLRLEVVELLEFGCDVCLPFGVAMQNGTTQPSEIIYARVEGVRNA